MSEAFDSLCSPDPFGPTVNGFLSLCFTSMFFNAISALFILVFGIVRLTQIRKEGYRAQLTPYSVINYERFLVGAVCTMLIFKLLYYFVYADERGVITVPTYHIIDIPVTVVAWVFSHYIISKEREKGQRHNWIIKLFWNIQYICYFLLSYEYTLAGKITDWRAITNVSITVFIFLMLILNLLFDHVHVKGADVTSPDAIKGSESTPLLGSQSTSSPNTSSSSPPFAADAPEVKANLFGQLLLTWATPLLDTGNQRSIEEQDLPPMLVVDSTKHATDLFEKYWFLELDSGEPSLLRALRRSFGVEFMANGVLKLVNDAGVLLAPFVLNRLLLFVEDTSAPMWQGILWAVALYACATLQSVCLHRYFYNLGRVGNNIRAALIGAVYRKAFRQSFKSRQIGTTGEVVNLQSIDAGKFQFSVQFLHMLWSAPLQMVVALIELILLVQWAGVTGFVVLILSVPLSTVLGRKMAAGSKELMDMKDKRAKAMNEVLQGIRVIKFFAWENSFSKKLEQLRDGEVKQLKSLAFIRATFFFIFFSTPLLVAVVTFATFIGLGGKLTPAIAFTALSLFNLLRAPLILLPTVITAFVELKVSMKRLSDYLSRDEFDDYVDRTKSSSKAITVSNGTFEWVANTPVLNNISFSVPRGSLVAIVGTVGSGKSSILQALLGEIPKTAGTVQVSGRVAYVSQQAWMQNESVKNNILFGQSYDDSKYKKTVKVCELSKDFAILPAEDETEIGEKGINLSGGQKQRISLARAVYSRSDVYLMDDPLSAVDVHVGKSIFENCIKGELDGTTRVLVTHNLNILPMVDKIFVISNGKIEEQGTFSELMSSGGRFQEILQELEKEAKTAKAKAEEEEKEALAKSQSLKKEGLTASAMIARSKTIEKKDLLTGSSSKITNDLGNSGSQSNPNTPIKRTRSITGVPPPQPPTGTLGRYDFDASEDASHQEVLLEDDDEEEEVILESSKGVKRSVTNTKANNNDNDSRPIANVGAIKTGQLIGQEGRSSGTISWQTYATFIKSIGGALVGFGILALFVLTTGTSATSDWWVSFWSDQEDANPGLRSPWFYLGVYGGIGGFFAIMTFLRSLGVFMAGLNGATRLHSGMLYSILRSPVAFFDTTPVGRILNRFTKDISVVDNEISQSLVQSLSTTFGVLTVFVVMGSTTSIIFVIIPGMIYLYRYVQNYYLQASLDLQRLDSTSKSPIFALFGETLAGVVTIRAYNKQETFEQLNEYKVDRNSQAWWMGTVANRWLTIRLESVGNFIVLAAATFAVVEKNNIPAGLVGLSITYAMQLTFQLNMLVRMSAQAENNLVSVERCAEYTDLPAEPPTDLPTGPVKNWPNSGTIEFRNFSFQYRPGLPLVLKNISCIIKPKEKIGIVGRTGAGKSSLMLALFRFNEASEGFIAIDGVRIETIGLNQLRRNLAIIPQDPMLFTGTVRSNLDPFSEYSDEDIWSSLKAVSLLTYVSQLPQKLESSVTENGENHSVGTRQLLCLARALLRKTKIIVMDEATASIDYETDSLIQKTIRKEFHSATVLTIAHRINTIIDSNKVMVLDQGQLVEFDTPQKLQQNEKSIFYSLVKEAEKQQEQTKQ